jgi:hypothetical protein
LLAELIREIRDAARVREEVLLSRVYGMLEAAGKMNPANHLVSTAVLLVLIMYRNPIFFEIKYLICQVCIFVLRNFVVEINDTDDAGVLMATFLKFAISLSICMYTASR